MGEVVDRVASRPRPRTRSPPPRTGGCGSRRGRAPRGPSSSRAPAGRPRRAARWPRRSCRPRAARRPVGRACRVIVARSSRGRVYEPLSSALGSRRAAPRPGRGSPRRPPPWGRAGPACSPSRSTIVTSLRSESKPISGARDVVEDDRVEPLALELLARPLDRLGAVLGGEPDQRLVGAALGGDAGEDVLGLARGAARGRRCPRARASPPRRAPARKSATAAAISSTCARGELRSHGVGELARSSRRRSRAHAGRLGKRRRWRRPGSPRRRGAPPRSASASAHPAARAVADEAHRVDRLAGPAGGDQDAQAVPGPAGAGQQRLDLGQQPLGLGQPAGAVLAARGERAPRRARSRARRARAASPGSPAWRRRAYMRSFIAGATSARRRAGEERGGQHRVGDPRGELGDRVRRGGRDQDTRRRWRPAARWPIGSWSGSGSPGKRAAQRVALELVDRAPARRRCPRTRPAPTKRCAAGVISTRTPWPGHGRQARELERLVGGDPAADAEKDAGHARHASPRAPALGLVVGSLILPAASSSSAIVR